MSEVTKVKSDHLQRAAYLYVRQSTLRPVSEHSHSTTRQYALRQRVLELGWPDERVFVIDEDLWRPAASDRHGFERLVAEVGGGKAGIIVCLEASRLARSALVWEGLLELCALRDTLLWVGDGLYDPGDPDDALALNGRVSDPEHTLRAPVSASLTQPLRGIDDA